MLPEAKVTVDVVVRSLCPEVGPDSTAMSNSTCLRENIGALGFYQEVVPGAGIGIIL
jgi:hypothetical protein